MLVIIFLTTLFATAYAKDSSTPATNNCEHCTVFGATRCHNGYWVQECGAGSHPYQCWDTVKMCGYVGKCKSCVHGWELGLSGSMLTVMITIGVEKGAAGEAVCVAI